MKKYFYVFFIYISTIFFIGCTSNKPLFEDYKFSNISFKNQLTDSEEMNILSYEYFYNGGGVGSGDFNNDGLPDLYFSANQSPNELFINKGNLKFEKTEAGVSGKPDSWKTGVSVIDINQDGWLDIYQCYSGKGENESRKNQLFINQGETNGRWAGKFLDKAAEYGLDDAGRTTQAAFFDKDKDGDLDAFIMNHNLKNYQRKEAVLMKAEIDSLAGDRLYENVNGKFIDITAKSGIKSNPLGFGLGLTVSDINSDSWPDIYVANDYVEEDYLYLNDGKGGFVESGKNAMGHFSYSAMGVDAADINNDGLVDIMTTDMLPNTNSRQKLLAFPDSWNVQKSMLDNGFHWQNMRNMLQLNQGNKDGIPQFSEIGNLMGISATDWSWSPLIADFDNDGNKDIFVTNGFVKDLTDLDFVKYYLDQETQKTNSGTASPYLEMLKKMPATATHHFAYKNNGNLSFDDITTNWGFGNNTVASGAIYIDLDLDGDLEIVSNNTNETSKIYKNNSIESNKNLGFLKIKNLPLGAKIKAYFNGQEHYYENYAVRGFLSSSIGNLHIGMADEVKIDSLLIINNDGKVIRKFNIAKNQTLDFNSIKTSEVYVSIITKPLFAENQKFEIDINENEFLDFSRQILLPKLYSRTNPKLCKADVDADGYEDIFVTAPSGKSNALFLGGEKGEFQKSKINFKDNIDIEDKDALFFDANNDKFPDLFIASGGYEQPLENEIQQSRLYLNDQKGNFKKSVIPNIYFNANTVKSLDIDQDSDLDLFIAGGVRSGLYPYCENSITLINDGKGNFTKGQSLELGIINGLQISNIQGDSKPEIIIAGEFEPIYYLEIKNGKVDSVRHKIFTNGWYTSLETSDLDNDGDQDIIVGGLGKNTSLSASSEFPLIQYYGDADQNMIIDLLMGTKIGNKIYPIYGRDELLEQSSFLKKKYNDYKSFSQEILEEIFDTEQKSKMQKMQAENLSSGILWNTKGEFSWQELPVLAQAAPINTILTYDFNNDGLKDIFLAGNESGFRIRIGKTDANKGLIILQKPNHTFSELRQTLSGLYLKADIKSALIINKELIVGTNQFGVKSYHLN